MPGKDIVVRSEKAKLPAPVAAQLRRLILEFLPEGESGVHSSIARERTFPVFLEREDAISRGLGELGTEKEPRVFDKDFPWFNLGMPRQAAPDCLVHIVVHAVRV